MYFETRATNSGRPTGTSRCPPIAASGGVAGTSGIRSATGSDHGGSAAAAGARQDQSDPTDGGRTTGRGAGAERGGRPTSAEKTGGPLGRDTVTGGRTCTIAGVGTDQGAEAERESSVEIKKGRINTETEVMMGTLEEKQGRDQEAQVEKKRDTKKEAQRYQRKVFLMVQNPTAITSAPRKARRAKRNTKRKGSRLKRHIPPRSQEVRKTQRKKLVVILQHKVRVEALKKKRELRKNVLVRMIWLQR